MIKTCLIVGLGQIGMEYDYEKKDEVSIFTHARAITKHPNFKLIGGVDTSSKKRNRFEKIYASQTFTDVNFALKKLKPDIVIVSTPTDSHSSIVTNIINSSKPEIILCEKPLAYKLNEAKKMVKICEEAGVKLFVNYMRSVDIGVGEIKRRIEIDEIKKPIKANIWYSKGLYNNGSHLLNLLSLWLGKIISVKLIKKGSLFNQLDPEPDFEIEYSHGTAIFRAAWEKSFSQLSVELLSTSGRLFYDYGGNSIEWQGTTYDPDFHGYKILDKNKEIINNSMNIYQFKVYDGIFKYFKNEKTPLVTGMQALDTLKGINSIIKQLEKNE